MKSFAFIFFTLALALISLAARSQSVVDLSQAVEDHTVVLEQTNGTGASSGSAVEGVIENRTEREINVDVFISKPLFLVNRGSGQNMVATQVYARDGGYMSDGKRSFVTLRPRERSPVTFIAYCADFEKDNPTSQEGFSVGEMPAELSSVTRNIAGYARANPERDMTIAAQVALWLAQGKIAEEIRTKFPFSDDDERLARELIR